MSCRAAHGSARTAGELGVSRPALQGALITVSVFYGVAVLRAADSAKTARLLIYLGRQAKHFANGALPRPGYRRKGKRARQLFILQGLPGVGPERAEQLLSHFVTVANVAKASAMELIALDGIGESTSAKIRWALDESRSRYEI